MQQWDYRVEPLSLQAGPMEIALKQAGWEGWELVTIIYPQGQANTTAWAVPVGVFRRPVTPETPMQASRYSTPPAPTGR